MKKYLLLLGVLALAFASAVYAAPFPTGLGGTGTSATPASGTIPIGTGLGSYTPALLTASGTLAILNASGSVTIVGTGATTTIQSVLNSLSAAGLASYNPATGVFTVSSSSLALGTASQHPASDFLASSTSFVSTFNTRTGAITLTSGDVTTALGFTPYNATNPSNFISSSTGNGLYYPLSSNPAGYVTSTAGGFATGTIVTAGSPLTVSGVATATIYGSESSTWIANFNQSRVMPTPTQLAAGATCGGIYPVFDAGLCHDDIYNALGSSTNILSGPYQYNYSYPIINDRAGIYVADQGVGGGATTWSFTPSYYNITSANSSTKVVSYTSVGGSPIYFNGEAVTYVGASAGLKPGTLYYVGSLTSSTLILYKNSTLTSTSSPNGSELGVLATPAATYDIGQNSSYGWGACGITLNGPNNGSSTGWYFGGTNGARSATLCNGSVQHFYYNIYTGDNTYFFTIQHYYSHLNANNPSGGLLWNDSTANSDEEMNLSQDVFADAQPSASSTAVSLGVHLQTSGFDDWECNGTSFDDTGVYLDWFDGQNNSFHAVNCRSENPGAGSGWIAYVPITTNAGNPNASVDIGLSNYQFLNDGSGGNAFTNMMQVGPNVKVTLSDVSVAANVFVGASTVTDFMTLGSGSTVTSIGFANQSDGPGVTYLYNTRVPVAGLITNAPTFLDSTLQVTGNFTYFNGYIGNPIVSTVSSTLSGFSPNYQICNGTSTINYTLPLLSNNSGLDFDLANRGTANCTITATSTNAIYQNGATSTVLTLTSGQTTRIVDDSAFWTVFSNANYATQVATTTINGVTGPTFTVSVVGTSTASSITTSSAQLFLNLLQYSSGTDINVGSNGVINFVNTPGFISTSTGLTIANLATSSISQFNNDSGYLKAAPATSTYSAQGSTITTTALTIATSGPLLSASVSGQTLTLTSITSSTLLAGYSTSTFTSLNNLTGNAIATGTTNQISVSSSTGQLVFSTPQNLNTSASVQFGSVTTTVFTATGTSTLQGVTEASGTQYYSLFASSTASTAATTINWNTGNVQELKLTTSTTITFTNTNPGARYILMLVQDGTGSRLVTWPSTVQWASGTAPTLTTTAGKLDIVTFVCANISSTDCYSGANLNYSP